MNDMKQKPLPIGKTRLYRHADCIEIWHVVGYNEKSGHNLWELKSTRWENNRPDRVGYDLVKDIEERRQQEHTQMTINNLKQKGII